jgi:hypothetical protein
MLDLIKELRNPKNQSDSFPKAPSALDLRAASTLERMFQVIKGLELSQQTMSKELSDAQITITKLQIALANRTKELEDAKKNIVNKPADPSDATAFTNASNTIVDTAGTEVPN